MPDFDPAIEAVLKFKDLLEPRSDGKAPLSEVGLSVHTRTFPGAKKSIFWSLGPSGDRFREDVEKFAADFGPDRLGQDGIDRIAEATLAAGRVLGLEPWDSRPSYVCVWLPDGNSVASFLRLAVIWLEGDAAKTQARQLP
jgi:hypothetical protein